MHYQTVYDEIFIIASDRFGRNFLYSLDSFLNSFSKKFTESVLKISKLVTATLWFSRYLLAPLVRGVLPVTKHLYRMRHQICLFEYNQYQPYTQIDNCLFIFTHIIHNSVCLSKLFDWMIFSSLWNLSSLKNTKRQTPLIVNSPLAVVCINQYLSSKFEGISRSYLFLTKH